MTTVLVLGLFFAMGCLMLVALRILLAQRNGLSTDAGGINHWHPDHSVCDNCPTLRKGLIKGWTVFVKGYTVLGYAMAVLAGAFALWYSPALFHLGHESWDRYSWCGDKSETAQTVVGKKRSETLGDFFSLRSYCARWAMSRRPEQ